MKRQHLTFLAIVIIVSIVIVSIYNQIKQRPKIGEVFYTSFASVYRTDLRYLYSISDLVAQVEVLDDLTSTNSVFVYGDNYPGEIVDCYARRKVKIRKIYQTSEGIVLDQILEIVEPIAVDHNNGIHQVSSYKYEASLKKGQIVTLVARIMDDGQYSIEYGGNAQISDRVVSDYPIILDISLNTLPNQGIDIEVFNRGIAVGYVVCSWDTGYTVIKTANKNYDFYYIYMPLTNETYFEVNEENLDDGPSNGGNYIAVGKLFPDANR